MNLFTAFNILLINPIITILVAIYQALMFLHVPFALGFSIILLTLLIRMLLYPLMAVQLRSAKKMQTITPHLNKLKEKHKGDMQTLQKETMKLYQEHGINPAAGCLPMLIQLPIIWGLYGVLQKVVGYRGHETLAQINQSIYLPSLKLHQMWDTHFFGAPLGQSPSQLVASAGFLILLVPLLTAVFQFLQSKMMVVSQPTPEKKPAKKGDEMDFAQTMQTQTMYFFPLMIGFLSFTFPIGLSLYWNTFTIFGIIQQYRIQGWGGLSPWIAKLRPVSAGK